VEVEEADFRAVEIANTQASKAQSAGQRVLLSLPSSAIYRCFGVFFVVSPKEFSSV
jgi:hypothetical protein